jgi:hypothetical protein
MVSSLSPSVFPRDKRRSIGFDHANSWQDSLNLVIERRKPFQQSLQFMLYSLFFYHMGDTASSAC